MQLLEHPIGKKAFFDSFGRKSVKSDHGNDILWYLFGLDWNMHMVGFKGMCNLDTIEAIHQLLYLVSHVYHTNCPN